MFQKGVLGLTAPLTRMNIELNEKKITIIVYIHSAQAYCI